MTGRRRRVFFPVMKLPVVLLLLPLLSSCYQNSLQGKAEETANKLFQRPSAPPVIAQWMLFPKAGGHRLDVVVNGRQTTVRNGGDYRTGRRIDPAMAGSVSAFRIDYANGGYEIFELVPKDASKSTVYVRAYNLKTRTMDPPKALSSVPNR